MGDKKMEKQKKEKDDSSPLPLFIVLFVIFVSVIVIMMVIGYGVTETSNRKVDDVTNQMFGEIEDANATQEWKDGWISAVKHFKVLWHSDKNNTIRL